MSSTVSRGGGERASPKPSTTQQRIDEVLRRKAEAERRVAERRELLRQEQQEKLAKINNIREIERRNRLKKNAEKELLRQKEALDRRQAQLEENEKRKEAILAKAHAATSRTANKENTKKWAFGSSTPRELSYLQNLNKEKRDSERRSRDMGHPISPTLHRPSASSTTNTPNAMTTSVYVFSPNRELRPTPIPRAAARVRNTNPNLTSSAPAANVMTQSMHISSSSSSSRRLPPSSHRSSSRPSQSTPLRAPRQTNAMNDKDKRGDSSRHGGSSTSSPISSPSKSIRRLPPQSSSSSTSSRPIPSPLTVSTTNQSIDNQHLSSSQSLRVTPTPPPTVSEDSDAGFSESSFDRGTSEKSTPIHIPDLPSPLIEEVTPREDHGMELSLPSSSSVDVPSHSVDDHISSPSLIDSSTLIPSIPTPLNDATLIEVKELNYDQSSTTPIDTTVVHHEELTTVEQMDTVPLHNQENLVDCSDETPEVAPVSIDTTVVHDETTVHQEETTIPHGETTVSTDATIVHEDVSHDETTVVHSDATVLHDEVTVVEERPSTISSNDLLVDMGESSIGVDNDMTPLVEEVTPLSHIPLSLADELGVSLNPITIVSEKRIEDTVVDSLADELAGVLMINGGKNGEEEKKEEADQVEEKMVSELNGSTSNNEDKTPIIDSTIPIKVEPIIKPPSPTPSNGDVTPYLPSGSSSGTESGESSPNTRRRRTEEKKAEMMKQSAILAMADNSAKERDERKARLAAIMNRTRGNGASSSTTTSSTMVSSMSSSSLSNDSPASSVLAKIAHITSNPRLLQVGEKSSGSTSDLSMGELPGAVPQF